MLEQRQERRLDPVFSCDLGEGAYADVVGREDERDHFRPSSSKAPNISETFR